LKTKYEVHLLHSNAHLTNRDIPTLVDSLNKDSLTHKQVSDKLDSSLTEAAMQTRVRRGLSHSVAERDESEVYKEFRRKSG